MTDWEGAAIIAASVVLVWLILAATMPAWDKPAVLFWSAIAFAFTGGSLWISEQLSKQSV